MKPIGPLYVQLAKEIPAFAICNLVLEPLNIQSGHSPYTWHSGSSVHSHQADVELLLQVQLKNSVGSFPKTRTH